MAEIGVDFPAGRIVEEADADQEELGEGAQCEDHGEDRQEPPGPGDET